MLRTRAETAKLAGVAITTDADPERAGFLAAREAALEIGRGRTESFIVFASGTHASVSLEVARGVRRAAEGAHVLVSGGADVLAGERESDGASLLSVLALPSKVRVAFATNGGAPAAIGERLGEALGPGGSYVLLSRAHVFEPEAVDAFHQVVHSSAVIGGGIVSGGTLAVALPGEAPEAATWAALRFADSLRMAVGVTPGVELLTEYMRVDAIEEGFVTLLDGGRPLEILQRALLGRTERSLVLVSIAPREPGDGRARGLLRGVGGVHPVRGAVHFGPEVQVGDRVAFATPDAHAASEDFRAMAQSLLPALAGGVPVAGLYVGCGSRGSRLFAKPGADARLIRGALGELPFAGMYSSFEIGPFDGRPRMHAYSGVLAVLYAPS